jgi:hemolysin activation/secretion protein
MSSGDGLSSGLTILCLCVLGPGAQALGQTPTVEPGIIEREFRAERPALSTGKIVVPATPRRSGVPGGDDVRFVLTRVDFDGGSVFTAAELSAFAAPLAGKEASLGDLYALADLITRAYSERGYPLSAAYVPAQEIEDGAARILIVEGYIAEVEIRGDPEKGRAALERIADKLKAERPIRGATLERYLLLANDIPGLNVRAIFDTQPASNGAARLILETQRWRYDAAAGINNRGSRALGRWRGVASAAENALLTGRERIALDFVQAFDARELSFVQLAASYLINAEGATASLAGTYTISEPGTPLLSALGFDSEGWTARLEFEHSLVRSRSRNLRLIAGFEMKDLDSAFGALANSRDRVRAARLAALFDAIDERGATTKVSATISKGVDIFDATRAGDPLKSRADGSGLFWSLSGEASRLQPISGAVEAVASMGGQWSSRPLLASEECGYGGQSFGRGFDNYELAGEHCLFGLAELRATFPIGSQKRRLQPYGYYDAGVVWQEGALPPGAARRATGQSVGGGLRFWFGDHLYTDLEFAKPLTRDVALEGDDDGRLFFTIWAAR